MHGNKRYPYPQIVTGDDWTVYNTTSLDETPKTDNLNKQMYVPMDAECNRCGIDHSRMIRRHELGHAKWSPATIGKLNGIRKDAVEAMEEVRINYLLGKYKLPVDEPVMCLDDIKMRYLDLIYNQSIADLMLYTLGSYSHHRDYEANKNSTFEALLELLNVAQEYDDLSPMRKAELAFTYSTVRDLTGEIRYSRAGSNPSYRKVQKLAKRLTEILNMFQDKPEPYQKPTPSDSNEGEAEEGEGDGDDETEKISYGVSELEKRMRKELMQEMQYRTTSGIGYWGSMEVLQPALTVNLQGRLKASRGYQAKDYGYNPKYINRFCVDRKIFKQKLNVKGGTILIDASGSMMFNGQDILEIMELLPAVTIAMYNGHYNTGQLRVIARNGKRVSENYLNTHSGGGNVVDGPALEWLATMPARRIWVSDMKVVGSYQSRNATGFNLLKECYDLCTKHRIINLKDVEEVKEHALKLNSVLK